MRLYLKIIPLMILCCITFKGPSQTPLYPNVQVSADLTKGNRLGSASTSRNITIDNNGHIYIVYKSKTDLILSKSIDNGKSYMPGKLIYRGEPASPEIAINDDGNVYVVWNDLYNREVLFCSSSDNGSTFTEPKIIAHEFFSSLHMAAYKNKVYVVERTGGKIFYNDNYGNGDFITVETGFSYVYTDIVVDESGRVYYVADDPNLYMYEFDDVQLTLKRIRLFPNRFINYSSYSLSDGPCGTFVFVGGGGAPTPFDIGYKMNVVSGEIEEIDLGLIDTGLEYRVLYADYEGTLIDGYTNAEGELLISVSYNQGVSFGNPIVVAQGNSQSISRSPVNDDIVVAYESKGVIYASVYESSLRRAELVEPLEELSFCEGASFELDFILSDHFGLNSVIEVLLSDSNGNFENPTLIGLIDNIESQKVTCKLPEDLLPSDSYLIKLESSIECIESNEIEIEIGTGASFSQLPSINIASFYKACKDRDDQIINNFPIIESNLSSDKFYFEWRRNGEILPEEDKNSIVAVESGTYEITVIDVLTNCKTSNSAQVYIGQSPEIQVEYLSENFDKGQNINVLVDGNGEYEFRIDDDRWQSSPLINNIGSGNHIVQTRDKYGCGQTEASILIIGYPSFFTPNGDGVNETWNIAALRDQEAVIYIYDRYGRLLSKISTQGGGWDGLNNGQKLPEDDYWFKVDYLDFNTRKRKYFSSHFTLKR